MIRINLLKPEAKAKAPAVEEIKIKEKRPLISPSLILGLVIIIAAVVAFYQLTSINRENNLLKATLEEKNKLGDVETKLERVEAQRNTIQKKIDLIRDLQSVKEAAVTIMDSINLDIPDWVWLNEVVYDKKEIRIRGRALTNKQVAEFISRLEASPSIENVELISSIQQETRNERFLEFSLTARYVPPQPPVPVSPVSNTKKEKK